ncbi:hypothetical protein HK101_006891 [Irineochytrium annulatum]|nr:hypothetical protein HK101_006891 [Irineochytrium annulatum]
MIASLLVVLPALAVASVSASIDIHAELTSTLASFPECARAACLKPIGATAENVCTKGGSSTLLLDNDATCQAAITACKSPLDVSTFKVLAPTVDALCHECFLDNGKSTASTACNFAGPSTAAVNTDFHAGITAAFAAIPACAVTNCVTPILATPENVCSNGGSQILLYTAPGACDVTTVACSKDDMDAYQEIAAQIDNLCGHCWEILNVGDSAGKNCNFDSAAAPPPTIPAQDFQAELVAALGVVPACAASCVSSLSATPANICTRGGYGNLIYDNEGACDLTQCSLADEQAFIGTVIAIGSICGKCWIANGGKTTGCNFGVGPPPPPPATTTTSAYTAPATTTAPSTKPATTPATAPATYTKPATTPATSTKAATTTNVPAPTYVSSTKAPVSTHKPKCIPKYRR